MSDTEGIFDVPFQVQRLIDNLGDKKEKLHVRENYKRRLMTIRKLIDHAITKFDTELLETPKRKSEHVK